MATTVSAGTFIGLYGYVRYTSSTNLEKLHERRPCEGCGEPSAGLDHCHAHGWIRGALCTRCNNAMAAVDARQAGPHAPALLEHWTNCPDCVTTFEAWSPDPSPAEVSYRGQKTSVYLSASLYAAWRASGVPLSELVRRGLELGDQADEDRLRRILREELRAELTAVHAPSLERVPAIAATVPTPVRTRSEEERPAGRMQEAARSACTHPRARVHKGLCGACGQHVT